MNFRVVENKLSPICSICEMRVKEKKFLESIGDRHKIIVICEECAYTIHCVYEGNM